jgi:hypothetical protein
MYRYALVMYRNLPFYLLSYLILALSLTETGWPKTKPVIPTEQANRCVFILLQPDFSLMDAKNWIQNKGGKVTLLAQPNGLIAYWDEAAAKLSVGSVGIQKVFSEAIPGLEISKKPPAVAALMRFYNDLIAGRVQDATKRSLSILPNEDTYLKPDAFPSPDIDYQSLLQNLEEKGVQNSRFKRPFWNQERMTAGELGNSEVMIGTVAVTLFFVESNGTIDPNSYTWTTAHRDSILNLALAGLNWWATQAVSYNQSVSFLINYYAPTDVRCQTGYEPILHASSEIDLWIDKIMTNFGYNYGDIFTKVASFNSWQIATYQTDWAYSAFVEYNPSPAPSAFTDGYSAFAYFGGPLTNLLFRSFGWAFNQVFPHESGHIFYACDEYYQPGYGGCTSCTPCNSHSHNTPNGNCEFCNPSSVACMMRGNSFILCAYTPGQIGWGLYHAGVPVLLLAPSWSDLVADSGSVFTQNLRIRNIGDSPTTLTISDLQSDQAWLTITPPASFPNNIAGQDSLDYTFNFNLSSLTSGGFYDAQIIVTSNDSGVPGTVDTIPISLYIKCNLVDQSGYLFSDIGFDPYWASQFRDITLIGTKIPDNSFYNTYIPTGKLDDGTAGPLGLGFNFDYFGQSYSSLYVAVNGAVSFTNSELNVNGYFQAMDILTPTPPPHPFLDARLIAIFWNDLWLKDIAQGGGHGAIYTYSNTISNPLALDSFIVEWYRVGNFNAASDTLTTFELVLSKDQGGQSNIALIYKDVGTTGLGTTATIGLFNQDCEAYPMYDRNGDVVYVGAAPVDTSGSGPCAMRPGDANADGNYSLSDIIAAVNYVFNKPGCLPMPLCWLSGAACRGDWDGSGTVSLSDVIRGVNFLFNKPGGPWTAGPSGACCLTAP